MPHLAAKQAQKLLHRSNIRLPPQSVLAEFQHLGCRGQRLVSLGSLEQLAHDSLLPFWHWPGSASRWLIRISRLLLGRRRRYLLHRPELFRLRPPEKQGVRPWERRNIRTARLNYQKVVADVRPKHIIRRR